MKSRTGILIVVMALIVGGCGAPKVTTSYRNIAEQAVAEGNFEAATANWRLYFEQQTLEENEIEPQYFAEAAKMAYQADRTDLALSWFEQAQASKYADPQMYLNLVALYRQKNNLSKELDALEFYQTNYQNQTDLEGVNARLFAIYSQINEREKALAFWPTMSLEDRQKEEHLDAYFSIQKKLKNEAVCDSVAAEILAINPKHVAALEWLGIKYYNQAETRYQSELKKYEENHTRVQHIKLTQALKTVTADFQKALSYFKPLWEMDQNSRYAAYLVNIYTRFEDPETANIYRKYLK
ncbi:hypothetical protein [Sunxiuqinia sp. sy24]|uniref:hypothetical protein n=1 Tax=Sunxiuqinia sp. sy24 TaxID=3461495 RepID=UPI004045DA36